MTLMYRTRRMVIVFAALVIFCFVISINTPSQAVSTTKTNDVITNFSPAIEALQSLNIKNRDSSEIYDRAKYGSGWTVKLGCDTRNIILNRDMINTIVDSNCNVTSGTLNDPYTGKVIIFKRGGSTSSAVQIDHVVSLSDAWQKGAQKLSSNVRVELANDPLELIAVDGQANLDKSDGDAATWLPPNKSFRCQYVARQIAVKQKYKLWLSQPMYSA